MSTERTYEDYLCDIIDNVDRAERFMEGIQSVDELIADERTSYAVVRALEIIGEAAKQIPDSMRSDNPDIHWRGMTGMRDKVAHDYFGVDLEVVWRTVKEELPRLRIGIQRMLDDVAGD